MAHLAITKLCQICRNEFAATSGNARFCSDACHLTAYAKRDGDCLIWQSSLDKDGYGYVKLRGGRVRKAHRAAYAEFVGDLDPALMVCHSCDTPACIEPRHLFQGNALANKLDCVGKGRHTHGLTVHTAKLTEAEARAVIASTEHRKALADRYGVTAENIDAIRNGKTWKHLHAGAVANQDQTQSSGL